MAWDWLNLRTFAVALQIGNQDLLTNSEGRDTVGLGAAERRRITPKRLKRPIVGMLAGAHA